MHTEDGKRQQICGFMRAESFSLGELVRQSSIVKENSAHCKLVQGKQGQARNVARLKF